MKLLFILIPLLFFTSITTASEGDHYQSEMDKTLEMVKHHHGGQSQFYFLADKFEYQSNEGDELINWDIQSWYGGDINKIWLKSEGEYKLDHSEFEEAEIELLYSRAVSAFWDLQGGVRYDMKPDPDRGYAVFAAHGLAPYWFEVDASSYISHKGKVSFKLEMEYELLLTQKLILQPRVELNAAFQDDPDIHIGSGLNNIETGLRLRYEFIREFAPYIGINWNKSFGETEDLLNRNNEESEHFSFVAGLRFWY